MSVTFKRGGSNFPVTGFTSSDLSVSGGSVSGFSGSGGGGHTYSFSITPSNFPSTITVTIPKGVASGGGGIYENDIVSKSFQASYSVSFDTSSMGVVLSNNISRGIAFIFKNIYMLEETVRATLDWVSHICQMSYQEDTPLEL